jgi:RHS repeat-associated protein
MDSALTALKRLLLALALVLSMVGYVFAAINPPSLSPGIDEGGRICEIRAAENGEAKRQLARYFYQYHEDGTGPDVRAYHEWADDGSFDTKLEWDANIRLTYVTCSVPCDHILIRNWPLGRRIAKHSQPVIPHHIGAGSQYHRVEKERLAREQNLGTTFYGWDGDTLAWETTNEQSTHYFYEPDSFIPLAQAVKNKPMQMHPTPDWSNRDYKVKEDPLWTQVLEPEPFDKLGFYHCDHLGTPQEITDEEGNIAWSAQYKAWGATREVISKAANQAGFKNPLRFQGQYFDHETGLHYNRYRYYDPETGRFISRDPIGYSGGLNLHVYAPNPVAWVDPFGLDVQANRAQGNAGRDALIKRLKNSRRFEYIDNEVRINTPKCGSYRQADILVYDRKAKKVVAIEVKTGEATRDKMQIARDAEIASGQGTTWKSKKVNDKTRIPGGKGAARGQYRPLK